MLKLLTLTHGNILATRVSDILDERDYDRMDPILQRILNKENKIRWYFEMDNFRGWTPASFWREVNMDLKHANDFEKIAMVGEKKWERWMTTLMKPFTSAEVRFFQTTDKEKAREWIEN